MNDSSRRKLQARLVECGLTNDVLAGELGISRATLYRRLNSDSLTVKDVRKIREALRMTADMVTEIFLA